MHIPEVRVLVDSLTGTWDLKFNVDSEQLNRKVSLGREQVTARGEQPNKIQIFPAKGIEPKPRGIVRRDATHSSINGVVNRKIVLVCKTRHASVTGE